MIEHTIKLLERSIKCLWFQLLFRMAAKAAASSCRLGFHEQSSETIRPNLSNRKWESCGKLADLLEWAASTDVERTNGLLVEGPKEEAVDRPVAFKSPDYV